MKATFPHFDENAYMTVEDPVDRATIDLAVTCFSFLFSQSERINGFFALELAIRIEAVYDTEEPRIFMTLDALLDNYDLFITPSHRVHAVRHGFVCRLTLTILGPKYRREHPGKHGNHKYLIENGTLGHAAFDTKDGLIRFLQITGLQIGQRHRHLYQTFLITGQYATNVMADQALFNRMKASGQFKTTVWGSNGELTTALIDDRLPGCNVIHYLNPNCPDREVHPSDSIPK
jgi:hypothetical protein